MRWSFKLARIAGIDVCIHVTFLLLLVFIGFSSFAAGGAAAAVHGVLYVCLVFLCVLLHEFGHAMAARRYGIRTPDITLLPIGGVARLERMPENPSQELVVAIAGPLVNVAIALLLFPFVRANLDPAGIPHLSAGLLTNLFLTNVILVVFNLIPAFPMDGGRVLRAFLAMRMDYAKATNIAATIGQILAFAGGLYGLHHQGPQGVMFVLIAVFIFFGAQNEAAFAQMKSASTNLRVQAAMVTQFRALPLDATLNDAVEMLLGSFATRLSRARTRGRSARPAHPRRPHHRAAQDRRGHARGRGDARGRAVAALHDALRSRVAGAEPKRAARAAGARFRRAARRALHAGKCGRAADGEGRARGGSRRGVPAPSLRAAAAARVKVATRKRCFNPELKPKS